MGREEITIADIRKKIFKEMTKNSERKYTKTRDK